MGIFSWLEKKFNKDQVGEELFLVHIKKGVKSLNKAMYFFDRIPQLTMVHYLSGASCQLYFNRLNSSLEQLIKARTRAEMIITNLEAKKNKVDYRSASVLNKYDLKLLELFSEASLNLNKEIKLLQRILRTNSVYRNIVPDQNDLIYIIDYLDLIKQKIKSVLASKR
ncbi:MAG: hypothetical protein KKA62_04285 [Nanoarchaeota archaeon]|nr:hypothetical protein [Nanoarchaeota archaeon]MBU1643972.1 hypothetical protein [Nanoarchaeota archaeon]MBU1977138.1 hypothetical protein [Nanoarchaeota archaeon]